MLNIEIIKFEAQDVITTSIPAPAKDCYCNDRCDPMENGVYHHHSEVCTDCKLLKFE